MACAGAARTLHSVYPGRFVLALGVSHARLVERVRGHMYGTPVATMTSYLETLSAAPSLVPGEQELPPLVLASLGPRMIDVARERTEGAVLYLVPPAHTAGTRARLGADARLVVEQAVVVAPDTDADEWRRRAHERLELWALLAGELR